MKELVGIDERDPFAGCVDAPAKYVSEERNPFAGCEERAAEDEDCALGAIEEEGLGDARPEEEHQEIISSIMELIFAQKIMSWKQTYSVLPENRLIPSDKDSQAPDVMVARRADKKRMVLFELCLPEKFESDKSKMINMMTNVRALEGFVYDYQNRVWFGYEWKDNVIVPKTDPSFSKFLNIRFANLI